MNSCFVNLVHWNLAQGYQDCRMNFENKWKGTHKALRDFISRQSKQRSSKTIAKPKLHKTRKLAVKLEVNKK